MSVNDTRNKVTTELFKVEQGPSEFSTTFIFGNEDHTLGNCLRHILMKREETDFCGYSVPHPYEPKMNVRLQTKNKPSIEVLKDGFKDLENASDLIDELFIKALQEFCPPPPSSSAATGRQEEMEESS